MLPAGSILLLSFCEVHVICIMINQNLANERGRREEKREGERERDVNKQINMLLCHSYNHTPTYPGRVRIGTINGVDAVSHIEPLVRSHTGGHVHDTTE